MSAGATPGAAGAADAVDAAIDAAIDDRDAQLQAARSLRARGRVAEALALLARLEARHPQFSRLHQERGHCHALRGDATAAIAALRRAVALNPTLPASWDMLAQLHRRQGEAAAAADAERQCAALGRLPREIVMANCLFADGDLAPADQILRAYLGRDGGNVGALRLLARICTERGALAEAEALLAQALAGADDFAAARFDHAMLLLQQQKPLAARRQAERLLAQDPANRAYRKLLGAAAIALGDHAAVIDLYAGLLAQDAAAAHPPAAHPPAAHPPAARPAASGPAQDPPTDRSELRLWRANALKITGRQSEAIADYRAVLATRPDEGVAWFGLANLKTYRFSDAELAQLRAAEAAAPGDPLNHSYLCFALGQALEDRADPAASWRFYARGNALRRAAGSWQAAAAADRARRIGQTFDADFFAARAGWGVEDPAPIFILGLPRSGSTLIEQILASHPQVEGTQELTEIGRYAAELGGRDPGCGLPARPEALAGLTARDARALGARFLEETSAYRRDGRPFFIDKMPGNFWHIGLIQLILPRATIIDVRRAPMACCFGNLKQAFAPGHHEFAYGIDDVAAYYRLYLAMMRHWDAVLPGRVLRIHHEDVVEQLAPSVRRLLAWCGLDFDPACLAFHETQRSVRTPSSEQVRQPIRRDSLDRWRAYAPWLAPLRAALGDAVTGERG